MNTVTENRLGTPRSRRGRRAVKVDEQKGQTFAFRGGEYYCPACDYHSPKKRAVTMHFNRMDTPGHAGAIQVPTKGERERLAVVGRQDYHCPNCTAEITDEAVLHFRKHPAGGESFHCTHCGGQILKSTRGWMEENLRSMESSRLVIQPAT